MSNRLFSQSITHVAFDTNGPVGESLFPTDDNGNIVYTGIINCKYSSDTIKSLCQEWIYDLEHIQKISINDLFVGITKINFELEIPVGEDYFSIGDIGTFKRHKSQVTCLCSIEIRNGKYRYSLRNFYTNRRHIPGEAKSEGPSNMIHWQRLNSLQKELDELMNRNSRNTEDISEYKNLIEAEKLSYKSEYDAVCKIIQEIKEFTVIEDF